MTDTYRIDGHKMMYHVKRVTEWLENKDAFPIYMEVSPCGTCNHRCFFCSVDFMGYQKTFIDTDILKERITELGELGLKSIMFAGEGEPFLHKDLPEIIVHTKNVGIDVSITTNGVLLYPDVSDQILNSVEWIKVSLNAGNAETYAKIHGTRANDFNKVLSNVEYTVKKRSDLNSRCALGIQILLFEENSREVEELTKTAKDLGVDYIVIKPYTHHSKNGHLVKINYKQYEDLSKKLETYNSKGFSVIFRANAMKKWDNKNRNFKKCVCLPFWSYIDASGTVWGCSAHLLENQFSYGSILNQTFKEIWEGEKRKNSLQWVEESLDIQSCKLNCRMGQVNQYLLELMDPPDHVNFI